MARILLGLVLGLPLAVIVCGLLAWAWPGGWRAVLVPTYISVFPVWAALTVIAQHSASWQRVLAGFGGAGVAGLALLWWLRLAA